VNNSEKYRVDHFDFWVYWTGKNLCFDEKALGLLIIYPLKLSWAAVTLFTIPLENSGFEQTK